MVMFLLIFGCVALINCRLEAQVEDSPPSQSGFVLYLTIFY